MFVRLANLKFYKLVNLIPCGTYMKYETKCLLIYLSTHIPQVAIGYLCILSVLDYYKNRIAVAKLL